MSALPEFSGQRAFCPKCRSNWTRARHVRAWPLGLRREHMRQECRDCGHAWREATAEDGEW